MTFHGCVTSETWSPRRALAQDSSVAPAVPAVSWDRLSGPAGRSAQASPTSQHCGRDAAAASSSERWPFLFLREGSLHREGQQPGGHPGPRLTLSCLCLSAGEAGGVQHNSHERRPPTTQPHPRRGAGGAGPSHNMTACIPAEQNLLSNSTEQHSSRRIRLLPEVTAPVAAEDVSLDGSLRA